MLSLLAILFGLLSGTLLSVLVGIIGSHRRIGFGWAFVLSLIFTPFVGLLLTLISSPIPGERNWGCIGTVVAFFGLLFLFGFLAVLFAGGLLLYLACA